MECDCDIRGGICQGKNNNEFVKLEEYGTWRKSLDRCKENDSYLYGNISTITEAKEMIDRSTFKEKTSLWLWIGVARQIYLSSDTGISIDTKSVIQCKKCHGSHCHLTSNCDNQKEKLLAVCSSNQSEPKPTKKDTKNYTIVIILPLIGCFIVISLVTLAVCYIRRRKGMIAGKDSASTSNASQYTRSPKSVHSLKAIITSKLSFWNDTSNCQDNFSDVSSVVTVVNLFKNRSY
ncbi:uncharacterized protein LOC134697273 [Mytilus trossulus]|uniref:uncharacterized protein LOC134697273 n=1 Tax=Mytilus trossulus TaxID=6551 RepID=UPI003007BBD8